MNIDEDIEKRSIWTNIALFMIGVAILAFMSLNRDRNQETAMPQTDEEIAQTAVHYNQNNAQAPAMFLMKNGSNTVKHAEHAPIDKTADVNPLTYYPLTTADDATTDNDRYNYIECSSNGPDTDELITASR